MKLKVKILRDTARLPTFGSAGAAGMDFYATEDGWHTVGSVSKIPLGVAVELPASHALLITSRSGHGVKHGAGVPHGYGLIDSDYRGELFMVIRAESSFGWKQGDRIAQGVVVELPSVDIEEVAELTETQRGEGGFGSTGT
jgi:dUTP pyrophosphatase